ncbi:MAG: hypothetical protein QXL57_03300 [Candidatus Bathyarchaeia archaeon]
MQKAKINVKEGEFGKERKCQYCGEWWIQRFSPERCPRCGYPINPTEQ